MFSDGKKRLGQYFYWQTIPEALFVGNVNRKSDGQSVTDGKDGKEKNTCTG